MRNAVVTCSLFLLLACGSRQPTVKTSVPLTPEQTAAYDHGVDFVTNLEGIEGRWRDEFERDLSIRVSSADLIAIVTLRTIRTDTDPEQNVTHRLIGSIERDLIGSPKARELELAVNETEPGYPSVHQNLSRLEQKKFIAYVKRGPDGRLHWHLATASEQMVTETEGKISQLNLVPKKDSGERVVVHTN